jgi:adenosine kinase
MAINEDRTGLSEAEIAAKLEALIITKGGDGASIHTKDGEIEIPVSKAASIEDPTGCGDAFRAGLLYGLMNQLDWETTGRIASLLGAIKIEQRGTQNHHFSMDEFKSRFQESFGREL